MEQLTFTKIDRFSESLGLVSGVDYGQGLIFKKSRENVVCFRWENHFGEIVIVI